MPRIKRKKQVSTRPTTRRLVLSEMDRKGLLDLLNDLATYMSYVREQQTAAVAEKRHVELAVGRLKKRLEVDWAGKENKEAELCRAHLSPEMTHLEDDLLKVQGELDKWTMELVGLDREWETVSRALVSLGREGAVTRRGHYSHP